MEGRGFSCPDRPMFCVTLRGKLTHHANTKGAHVTNLGALESFIDHDAVNYELNGKKESFTFPADAVLKFHVAVAAMKADGESRFDRLKIYELVAPVFGSVWNQEKATFTGGLMAKLLKAGQPFVVIDRLASAVFVKLQYDDSELAEAMFRTGDLPKAIREQAARRRCPGSSPQ